MYIYVTEPDRIDQDELVGAFGGTQIELFQGSPSFAGNTERDFDTIVIRSETIVNKDIKQLFPKLRNVVRIGTGLDNVDLDYCKQANINVYNAAGANADAVSEYIVAIILYILRKLNTLTEKDLVEWNRFKFIGHSMTDQTIGLIGFGNIGRLLYEKLSGFRYKGFLVYDPYINAQNIPAGITMAGSVDEILKKSTIISLHVPLTLETEHIINAKNLALLQPDALLINASRGGVVDEAAVLEALSHREFIYAADTVRNEPHGNQELFRHNNIVVTPHIASLTSASERDMIHVAIHNFQQGKNVPIG